MKRSVTLLFQRGESFKGKILSFCLLFSFVTINSENVHNTSFISFCYTISQYSVHSHTIAIYYTGLSEGSPPLQTTKNHPNLLLSTGRDVSFSERLSPLSFTFTRLHSCLNQTPYLSYEYTSWYHLFSFSSSSVYTDKVDTYTSIVF